MAQRRRGKFLLLLGALVAVLVSALFWFRAPPLTEELARQHAQDRLERYGQSVGLDVAKLGEPRSVPAAKVPYGFEWLYSDERGEVRVIIWVDKSGWTNIAIDGEIERVFDRPVPRKPTRG